MKTPFFLLQLDEPKEEKKKEEKKAESEDEDMGFGAFKYIFSFLLIN